MMTILEFDFIPDVIGPTVHHFVRDPTQHCRKESIGRDWVLQFEKMLS